MAKSLIATQPQGAIGFKKRRLISLWLGDIPVFGYLFRSDSKSRQKSNLLVFLTPTIVQEEDFQPTPTSLLKNPVPTKDTAGDDWSAWDSAKPKDWNADDVSPASGKVDEALWQRQEATAAGPAKPEARIKGLAWAPVFFRPSRPFSGFGLRISDFNRRIWEPFC
jgi:hypothetical protein